MFYKIDQSKFSVDKVFLQLSRVPQLGTNHERKEVQRHSALKRRATKRPSTSLDTALERGR